jgi:hypothetical protein
VLRVEDIRAAGQQPADDGALRRVEIRDERVSLLVFWSIASLVPLTFLEVPSGGLTLIVWTQKTGVFLQSTEATPCGHVLNETLPPKTPLRTPCSWPPWLWFSREKSLKIFKAL